MAKNKELLNDFLEFWDTYDYKIHRYDAELAYFALRRKGIDHKEIIKAVKGYFAFLKIKRIHEKFKQNQMYPTTFLRKERWRDYIGITYKPPM